MNKQIFDIKRFGKYFCTELTTILKANWVNLLVMVCIGLIAELTVGLFSTIFSGHWTGMPAPTRFVPFAVFLVLMSMVYPAKFYGHITDKKAGSAYLMLPASRFEKFLSMVLNCAVIIPFVSIAIFLGIDALIALIDPTISSQAICSTSIIPDGVLQDGKFVVGGEVLPISAAMVNPFLYADDFIFGILIYLLGALYFKKNKVAKTFVACLIAGFALNIITSVLAVCFGGSFMDMALTSDNMPKFLEHVLAHVGLYDTINDTIFNVGILAVIWNRIRTIKQ